MEEIWKDIEGYEGLYQVSNTGKIKSIDRNVKCGSFTIFVKGKIRKLFLRSDYLSVVLSKENKLVNRPVHRLVATAFIPNPDNKPQVNHLDGNKLNNNDWNLEWATARDNRQHSIKNKLQEGIKGEENVNSKLNDLDVLEILQIHKMYGLNQQLTAKEYGVAQPTISNILKRKNWNHIPL